MIYLSLSHEEALELFECLVRTDKVILASQLKKELLKTLSEVDLNQEKRNLGLITWLKKQQSILDSFKEQKNVSKQ